MSFISGNQIRQYLSRNISHREREDNNGIQILKLHKYFFTIKMQMQEEGRGGYPEKPSTGLSGS